MHRQYDVVTRVLPAVRKITCSPYWYCNLNVVLKTLFIYYLLLLRRSSTQKKVWIRANKIYYVTFFLLLRLTNTLTCLLTYIVIYATETLGNNNRQHRHACNSHAVIVSASSKNQTTGLLSHSHTRQLNGTSASERTLVLAVSRPIQNTIPLSLQLLRAYVSSIIRT